MITCTLHKTMVSDLPDSYVLKTHIGSLTKELIKFYQTQKEDKNTNKNMARNFNIVESFLGHLCNGNVKFQPYTASTITYKGKKTCVYLTSVEKENDYLLLKYAISNSRIPKYSLE